MEGQRYVCGGREDDAILKLRNDNTESADMNEEI